MPGNLYQKTDRVMPQSLFVRRVGLVTGPHTCEVLKTMIRRGELSRIHEVSVDAATWVYATEYPQLFDPHAEKKDLDMAIDGLFDSEPQSEPQSKPCPEPPSEPSADSPWWYEANDEPAGPVSLENLRDLIYAGSINMNDRVWTQGMNDWRPLGDLPGF